ncbi:hypothetical protein HMPREF1870_01889 [Bacteroidales bacterium KA00344]|nr:hypothetical protein HMPREF1870_01889 [Bacteroidales bacterium KA00344]
MLRVFENRKTMAGNSRFLSHIHNLLLINNLQKKTVLYPHFCPFIRPALGLNRVATTPYRQRG